MNDEYFIEVEKILGFCPPSADFVTMGYLLKNSPQETADQIKSNIDKT